MKLMTKELERQMPKLYSQDGKGFDAIVYARYFHCFSNWLWLATEYDPTDKIFFGYVCGFEKEWGNFSLEEMEGIQGVERDLYFTPKPLKEVLKEEQNMDSTKEEW
jgi:hypothetical protein